MGCSNSQANRELARALRYMLSRWNSLTRFLEDGRIQIDNNAAERAMRALGRKNYLFAGSNKGGACAAAFYSLIETASVRSAQSLKASARGLVSL